MKRSFLLLISVVLAAGIVSGQVPDNIEGSWAGTLKTIAGDIRLVFNFTKTDADTLSGTIDSPDQNAVGIPMGKIYFNGDTLVAGVPMVRGTYKGICCGDSIIKGTWSQLGRSYDLELKKNGAPVSYVRPQTPVPPFPYHEEEVTFTNSVENFELAGTLTLPEGKGPFAAVVMITGSGAQDRDETIFHHKPFMVIADYLTRNGIAVLRYDDRGTGKSKGKMTDATTFTLADDAEAALTYLMQRPEINHSKIGLAGHSEGSMIAAIIGSRNRNVAFIISLAGPGIRGYDLLLTQARDILTASGSSQKEIDETLATNSQLFKMVEEETDTHKFANEAISWYSKELDKQGITAEQRKEKMTAFAQGLSSVNNPWMRYFIQTDPAQFWAKVKCPVLALNGQKDLQVNYEQNLPAIKTALKNGGNNNIKTVELPGLNHLFQHADKGTPNEYISIEETFSPDVLDLMTRWIKKTERIK